MSSIKVRLKRARASLSELALSDLFVLAVDNSIGDRVFVRGLITPEKLYESICIFSNTATLTEYRNTPRLFAQETPVVRVCFDGNFIVRV